MLKKITVEIEYEDYSEENSKALLLGTLFEKAEASQKYSDEELNPEKYLKDIMEIVCLTKRIKVLEEGEE